MDVVQETDANGTRLATYTRSGNIGGLLARTGATSTDHLYYHYDGSGNVSQLTDSTQAVVANYSYDAFGNSTASGPRAGRSTRSTWLRSPR